MPLYRCTCPDGSLPESARAEIANALTEIHCDVTGAPKTFVHVFFFNDADATAHAIAGTIRAGRTEDQKRDLHTRMAHAYANAAKITQDSITVTTTDIPARWTMEGGSLLPEPGEEEAWLAKHHAAAES